MGRSFAEFAMCVMDCLPFGENGFWVAAMSKNTKAES